MKIDLPLRIVYFGTPDFSADLLQRLLEDDSLQVSVVAVVTQNDARVGRKQILTPSPVKALANQHDIPVFHSWNELVQNTVAFDVGLVFAYGKILPAAALALAPHGYWNVHPSLLPKYRGPSPVAGALLAGEFATGCTIMLMDEQMDHGPIIQQAQTYIFPQEQRAQLTQRLVKLGYKLLSQSLTSFIDTGRIETVEQAHAQATYTKLMDKDDGYVSFKEVFSELNSQPQTVNSQLFNTWRAYYPWPGVWTTVSIGGITKRMILTQMAIIDGRPALTHVQLEGKNEGELRQFLRAYGDQLADPEEGTDKKGE